MVSSLRHDAFQHEQASTTLLVILVLLVLLDAGLGDTVQVTLAGLGDAAATLVLVGLKDTDLLEGLEDLAVDGAGGVHVVGGTGAAVLGATVGLAQAADTDGLAHVDVAGAGGGADVVPEDSVNDCSLVGKKRFQDVPVNVLGRELLLVTGLDGVNPTCRPMSRQHVFNKRCARHSVPRSARDSGFSMPEKYSRCPVARPCQQQ